MGFLSMIARLKKSIKWTPLPPELAKQIREVFTENFAIEAKNGQFIVEGYIFPEELTVRVGYITKGQLKQANVEVSLDFNASKQNAIKSIYFAVDCAASFVQDLFERGQDLSGFPHSWKSFTMEKKKVFMQVSTVNTKLESEANSLLGDSTDTLVHGKLDDSLTEDLEESAKHALIEDE
ncbi:MAG: hypothetical protein A2Z20_04885 [Bdellovibrionales bacterium RBG_16_40_8]|nr:MAG: hypothetical protein A2Z20_04885 [Bdellovibrionales bacterium RBG_16_40_8]